MLGGLTPRDFLRRYWQRKPLLVRGAYRKFRPVLSRAELFALAGRDDVESRLVTRTRTRSGGWALAHGPFQRRALPRLAERRWTLLVQGVDLYDDGAHALLQSFRFVGDARLDDLMISWASAGGGVGPHVDSYDVFLLQAHGRRRWRIGKQRRYELTPGAPLKILRGFSPTAEYVLEPGDLLYLPPHWGHEGVALDGDCMTYSIGMRAPSRGGLAAELVQRLAEAHDDASLYTDPHPSPGPPAAIPPGLRGFAADAVQRLTARPAALARALGEVLSEPKAHVWFEKSAARWQRGGVALDRRTRMLYDARHVFINGEATLVAGRDSLVLRRLADERRLDSGAVQRASRAVRALLREWFNAGWLHSAVRAKP